jgi:hypothetical protein
MTEAATVPPLAARRTRLTMEDLLKENRKLEVDLSGLKV